MDQIVLANRHHAYHVHHTQNPLFIAIEAMLHLLNLHSVFMVFKSEFTCIPHIHHLNANSVILICIFCACYMLVFIRHES